MTSASISTTRTLSTSGLVSGFETSSRQFFRPIRPSFWHRLWTAYRQGGWPKVLETLRQDEQE